MQLITNRARAYVYAGEWAADCPGQCGNVEFLFDLADVSNPNSPRVVRKTQFFCSYCRHVCGIDWASDEEAIMLELKRRPIPHTRNWYPKDHDVAIRFKLPHGQTVAELAHESEENGV